MKIYEERISAGHDDDVVVFLIGARVRRWWKIHRWLPVALAMPRMIRELEAHPELGLLGYEGWGGRTSIMVQYWKSKEHLYNYARNRNAEHLPAWRHFNQHVAKSADIGVWHETYVVPRSGIDTLYSNMPAFGLARATRVRPADSHRGRRGSEESTPRPPRSSIAA